MTKTKKRNAGKALDNPAQESVINNAPKLYEDFPVGSVTHQGDLIIVAIAALPRSAQSRSSRQLAEGNTQGSRHVAERGSVYDADPSEVQRLVLAATTSAGRGCLVESRYVGPVFVSPESPTEHDLTHPEHGHKGFPAGTVCAVVYQRNLDAEEREQRSRD